MLCQYDIVEEGERGERGWKEGLDRELSNQKPRKVIVAVIMIMIFNNNNFFIINDDDNNDNNIKNKRKLVQIT